MNQNERLNFLIDAFKEDSLEYKNLNEPMSIHWTQKVESFYATSIASSSIC